jgi:hypothetical protein
LSASTNAPSSHGIATLSSSTCRPQNSVSGLSAHTSMVAIAQPGAMPTLRASISSSSADTTM